MREQSGSTPPELPEPEEVIQGISQELGLNPNAKPEWGYGPPVEPVFPEEALSLFARRQAHHCLARLHYFLEWRLQGDKPKVNTQDLLYTYELVREEQVVDFDPDYDLSHVLGAAKRHLAWLNELRQYEETPIYDQRIKVYSAIHDLMEQVVCPYTPDAAQSDQVDANAPEPTDDMAAEAGEDDMPF